MDSELTTVTFEQVHFNLVALLGPYPLQRFLPSAAAVSFLK